jgi:hypothetical protein
MKTYRSDEPTRVRSVPSTLECSLRDGDKNRWIRSIYVKLSITIIACTFLGVRGAHLTTIPVALLGLVWAFHDFRNRKGTGVSLRVVRDQLHVERRANGTSFELPMHELLDVRFDTKSIQKNLNMARADGVNTVFGMSSSHAIGLDVSRIEMVTRDESILLGEEFISHSMCADALRSIRLFLRAHGWKPEDERSDDAPTDE